LTFPSRKDIENVARDVLRNMAAPSAAGGRARVPSASSPQWTPSARAHDDDGPRGSELVSEKDVRAAKARGESVLVVPERTLVTPLARDAAYECGIEIRVGGDPATQVVATQAAGPPGGPAPSAGGRVALGSDHGGFALKAAVKAHLRSRGIPVEDVGTHTADSCDYPDFAAHVAKSVAMNEASWGIVIDGAGIGSCMAAGKVPGVLAATCHDVRTAKNSREHNGANVLCIGSGTLDERAAFAVIDAWLDTPFAGGRHGRRVDKIWAIERSFTR
jgi:ribose 5-phosphate isomerase B